jgi:hypothetical protein
VLQTQQHNKVWILHIRTDQLLLVLSIQSLNQQPVHIAGADILQLVLAESLLNRQWSRKTGGYPTI